MDGLLNLSFQTIDWAGLEAALFPFVASMKETAQDPQFHGEGDVWTHTKLVCEALVQLEGFRNLQEEQQQAVFLAALLHDIGKIPTTRREDGRWVSPNHALTGAKMARQFLWQELGLCGTPEKQQLRETVCSLIRYHSFPPHALDDPQGKRKLLALAASGENCPLFTVSLLCLLSQADALGRVCQDEMVERVLLCQELARESGCEHGPFPFPSPYTKVSYLGGKNIAPEVELYDDTWGEVILLSGLPGTGKDTWTRAHCDGLSVVSLDDIRRAHHISPTENQSKVLEIAREQARELLRRKEPFVWNATNLSPMVRQKQVSLFTSYRAATKIVYLETAWEEQLRRNANRREAVPQSVLCHMLGELVPPEGKEAGTVQWLCV